MVQRRIEALDTAAPAYTLSGEPACEARVVQDLSRLATGIDSEVGDALRALVLTGPFARGEGGVVERDGEICAAEPGYQLLALFRRKAERHARALAMMAATWSRLLRAPVAIEPLAESELTAVPASRFWFHVGAGQHITLVGDTTLTRMVPLRTALAIRKDEAARVLCEGLAQLALVALDGELSEARQAEFMHQAVLRCGDAWLLRRGHYAAALRERARALQLLHAGAALRAGYADAIAYSERPDRWHAGGTNTQAWLDASRRWLAAWYLDFEASYAGTPRDALGYARDPRALLSAWGVALADRPSPRHGWFRRGRARPHPLDRLLRSGVLLGFAPQLPAARLEAAALLSAAGTKRGEESGSNRELASRLRALTEAALSDPRGAPFAPSSHAVATP